VIVSSRPCWRLVRIVNEGGESNINDFCEEGKVFLVIMLTVVLLGIHLDVIEGVRGKGSPLPCGVVRLRNEMNDPVATNNSAVR
jgi:hypothetical protein